MNIGGAQSKIGNQSAYGTATSGLGPLPVTGCPTAYVSEGPNVAPHTKLFSAVIRGMSGSGASALLSQGRDSHNVKKELEQLFLNLFNGHLFQSSKMHLAQQLFTAPKRSFLQCLLAVELDLRPSTWRICAVSIATVAYGGSLGWQTFSCRS